MPKAYQFEENSIGQKIRERRTEIGLSQGNLGERLDVSYQQIQKYENGMSQITVARLQKVARCLGVSIDYFLKDLPLGKEAPSPYNTLSAEEKRLLKLFRAVPNPSVRLAFLRLIKAAGRQHEKKSPRK